MGKKCIAYKCKIWALISISILTVTMCILKNLLGISLLKDGWYGYLISINLFLIWIVTIKMKFMTSYVVKTIIVLIIIFCCLVGRLSLNYTDYYYMYSPNEKHQLILKAYTKGVFEQEGALEIHQVYYGIFKKKIYKTITANESAPIMGPELKCEESSIVTGVMRGSVVYDTYFFLFEWINEDTLIISYKFPNNLDSMHKDAMKNILKL